MITITYEDLLKQLKELTFKVRKYADIGLKNFNEDEEEFWDMCEENDKAENLIKGLEIKICLLKTR